MLKTFGHSLAPQEPCCLACSDRATVAEGPLEGPCTHDYYCGADICDAYAGSNVAGEHDSLGISALEWAIMFRSSAALLAALVVASTLLVAPTNSRAIETAFTHGHLSDESFETDFSRDLLQAPFVGDEGMPSCCCDRRHHS